MLKRYYPVHPWVFYLNLQEINNSSENLKKEIKLAREKLEELLIPRDPADDKPAIMEIRAGAGGDEAALFAGNLFRMYSRYCEAKGWKIRVMSANQTSLDGYKEVIFTAEGEGAYGKKGNEKLEIYHISLPLFLCITE